jgi:hypothetical protein
VIGVEPGAYLADVITNGHPNSERLTRPRPSSRPWPDNSAHDGELLPRAQSRARSPTMLGDPRRGTPRPLCLQSAAGPLGAPVSHARAAHGRLTASTKTEEHAMGHAPCVLGAHPQLTSQRGRSTARPSQQLTLGSAQRLQPNGYECATHYSVESKSSSLAFSIAATVRRPISS